MLDTMPDERPSRAARNQGDHAALLDAWAQHRRQLHVLCRRWAGSTAAETEDILSRVIVKALEDDASRTVAIESYPAWLTRIAWNLCMSLHRERAFRRRALEQFARDAATEPREVTSPEALRLRSELGAYLARAVDGLPPRLLEAFRRRALEDMPYEQIAAELALTNEAVRKRVQEARAILQTRVDAYEREGGTTRERRARRRTGY